VSRPAEPINKHLNGRRGQVFGEWYPRKGRETLGAVLVELRTLPRLLLRRYEMTTHTQVPALKYE